MPFDFGSKECLECGKIVVHKVARDIIRKKFCSRSCLGSYTVKYKLPKDHYKKMIEKNNTPEVNAKKAHRGENHPRYIKDRSLLKSKRPPYEYKKWREAVFKRDDFTCQICKSRGGKLNADHIKPYCLYPELRDDVTNGRTLCVPCHKKTDTYGTNLVWMIKKGLYNAEQK